MTRKRLEKVMKENRQAIFPVSGDCLEGARVMDGGKVCVDFTRRPAPPRGNVRESIANADICLCLATFPGRRHPAVMLKEYGGVWGLWQMVSTCYGRRPGGTWKMDCGMEAREIYGVVIASWDQDGHLLWERDSDSFPAELATTPTIHGDNCGDPMPIKGVPTGK